MNHLVFVYGTLKTGEPNHHVISSGGGEGRSLCLGKGRTAQKFPLVIGSRYNIPYLLDAPGKGHQIKGQVYRVDERMLERLDVLEGVPDHYQRRQEKVVLFEDNKAAADEISKVDEKEEELDCWLYIQGNFKQELLEFPHLDEYCPETYKDKPYVPRSERTDFNRDFYREDVYKQDK